MEQNDTLQTNPLLYPSDTPFATAAFQDIRPEHFKPALEFRIAEARKVLKKIVAQKETPTFDNTLLPVEIETEKISRIELILFNLNSAETTPEIQKAAQDVSPLLTKFGSEVMLNKKLFERVDYIYKNREALKLSEEQTRMAMLTSEEMRRGGVDLEPAEKSKLTKLQTKISKLNLKFDENVLADTNTYTIHITDENDLAGLPKSVIEAAAMTAKEKELDGWIFSLKYPSYEPFMKYAENRALREKLYRAYCSRGNRGNKNDNKKVVAELVNLRLQLAQMLGFKNFAQYVLTEQMAETPERVNSLIDNLFKASRPVAEAEIDELKKFAKKSGFKEELMPWDFSFYSEKLKNEKFGFDEESVKPYFKLENVIDGVFGLATKLYGITFTKTNDIQLYHPDVITYKVLDEDGSFLAVFYADFFPRAGKQGGAWMTEYRAQSNINGQMIRPHISICCNFTKPTETKPSLLTFNEVETFLHEFGHALHGMLANTTYPSMSGTNVYRDFVELPSQIMENWASETEWTKDFAKHYQTGETIPAELMQKLTASRNFETGYKTQRQLTFGICDMAWHTLESEFTGDITSFERNAVQKTQLLPVVDGTNTSTAFSHIFSGGYASGYYGYKWAEVLDADAFAVFKKNGIFDKETASRFRHKLLEKGGTAHPMELYKDFCGHEPSIDALLIRDGLKTAE